MFWGALNALLSSVSSIFWKKSLSVNVLPDKLFYAVGMLGSLVLSVGLVAFGKFGVPKEAWLLLLPIVDAFAVSYAGMLQQSVYREEKISALLPYENLASVFTIVAAFFLFRDASVITLCVAVAAMALVFFANFDFANRSFPKNFRPILALGGLNAARSLAMGFALAHLTSPTFYSLRNFAAAAIVAVPIFLAGQWGMVRTAGAGFYAPRMTASFLGAISALVAFTLVSSLGLVTTTLLGFLSMGTTMALGYFVLGEKPERKNVFLAIAVASLVAVGAYFRNA